MHYVVVHLKFTKIVQFTFCVFMVNSITFSVLKTSFV